MDFTAGDENSPGEAVDEGDAKGLGIRTPFFLFLTRYFKHFSELFREARVRLLSKHIGFHFSVGRGMHPHSMEHQAKETLGYPQPPEWLGSVVRFLKIARSRSGVPDLVG